MYFLIFRLCLLVIVKSRKLFTGNQTTCIKDFIGDGICDLACMIPTRYYDAPSEPSTDLQAIKASDCSSLCMNTNCTISLLSNAVCDPECNSAICGWDGGYCGYCASGCFESNLTSAIVPLQCNTPECMYGNNYYG